MSTDVTRRWVEAARILAEHPDREVPCPNCQNEFLEVLDVPWEGESGAYIERYLQCQSCGAVNTIRIRSPAQQREGGVEGLTEKTKSAEGGH
jgi:hypothetical protein